MNELLGLLSFIFAIAGIVITLLGVADGAKGEHTKATWKLLLALILFLAI